MTVWTNGEQEAQSDCDIISQRSVEMIDRLYNKWFSIETLSAELKLLSPCLTPYFVIFYYRELLM